jgi:hypothetical protein
MEEHYKVAELAVPPLFLLFRTSLFQQPEWQDAHRLFVHAKSNLVEFLKGVGSVLDGYDEFSASGV